MFFLLLEKQEITLPASIQGAQEGTDQKYTVMKLSTPSKTPVYPSPFWLLRQFLCLYPGCVCITREQEHQDKRKVMFSLGERLVHLLMQINMINWEEAASPLCQLLFKKGSMAGIYALLLNCASFPPVKEGNNDTERRQTVHVHFLLAHNSTEIPKHMRESNKQYQ